MPLIYPPHDPRRADSRLYKGGGDGGAGAMQQQEALRQDKIKSAIDAINYRFGNTDSIDKPAYIGAGGDWNATVAGAASNKAQRDAQYADVADAVRQTAMRDLDRQYGQASQKNLFGLARSGLLGGSADAESGGQLKELYGEGQLKAQQAGLNAASDLRTQDEKTRQNLITMAESGLDTGTAGSLAAGQMAAAADSAKSAAAGASVGRLFDDLSQAYVMNQVMKSRYPQQQQASSGYGTPSLYGTNRYVGTAGG